MITKIVNLLEFLSIWLICTALLAIPLFLFSEILMLDVLFSSLDYPTPNNSPELQKYMGASLPVNRLKNRFLLAGLLALPITYFVYKITVNHKKTKVFIITLGIILSLGWLLLNKVFGNILEVN